MSSPVSSRRMSLNPGRFRDCVRAPRPCAFTAAAFVASIVTACVGAPTPESERAVRELWGEYLASKQGRFAANAATPSPLWSAAEQKRWPLYDLASLFLDDHAVAEVLSVEPVNAAADSAYQIVTRFWPEGAARLDSSATPQLTMTVYARREGRRWALASALTYKTSTWSRETRGRIAYRLAPALRFDPAKADRAAAFVDSLATAFGVPAPPRIEYYVTESVDQAMEILGAVVPQRFGPNGGFARPVNAQVFSGIPALGEDYRHELAHVLLMPIIRDGTSSLLASEGVPTWFGGTAGRDFRGSVRHLASLLRADPTLDLDRIVYDMSVASEIRNPAGAVLAQMVHESGGVEAVREYLRTPGRAIPDTLERLLKRPWDSIAADWRRRVDEIAASEVPKYRVRFVRSARKELERLPDQVLQRVWPRIEALTDEPRPQGCRKLRGARDLWRIRVGDYRVDLSGR